LNISFYTKVNEKILCKIIRESIVNFSSIFILYFWEKEVIIIRNGEEITKELKKERN
jgi:hypothetical protein